MEHNKFILNSIYTAVSVQHIETHSKQYNIYKFTSDKIFLSLTTEFAGIYNKDFFAEFSALWPNRQTLASLMTSRLSPHPPPPPQEIPGSR